MKKLITIAIIAILSTPVMAMSYADCEYVAGKIADVVMMRKDGATREQAIEELERRGVYEKITAGIVDAAFSFPVDWRYFKIREFAMRACLKG